MGLILSGTGFHLEMAKVREEGVDDGYGPVKSYWVIARKPDECVRTFLLIAAVGTVSA